MERTLHRNRGRLFASLALAALFACDGCDPGPGSSSPRAAGARDAEGAPDDSAMPPETGGRPPPAPPAARKPESRRNRLDLGRALDLLASWQREDGLWALDGRPGGAAAAGDPAFTALALLSFSACNCTHKHGRHKRNVKEGLRSVVARGKPDGPPAGTGRDTPGIFTQAVLAWVLLEQSQMSRSSIVASAADAALDELLKQQGGKGSWRSDVEEHDIVFTAWAVLALRSACERENPRAREALERAYGFLLAQLGPDGRADPLREDRYFARAFGKPLPPRRVQLLSAAALAGIARVRGKATLTVEPVRLGFEALDLDFPPSGETVWDCGLLEWLWTDFAYWACNHHPRRSVWKWKSGFLDCLSGRAVWADQELLWRLPAPPFEDPQGRWTHLLGTLLYLFAFLHPYSDWPDLLEQK